MEEIFADMDDIAVRIHGRAFTFKLNGADVDEFRTNLCKELNDKFSENISLGKLFGKYVVQKSCGDEPIYIFIDDIDEDVFKEVSKYSPRKKCTVIVAGKSKKRCLKRDGCEEFFFNNPFTPDEVKTYLNNIAAKFDDPRLQEKTMVREFGIYYQRYDEIDDQKRAEEKAISWFSERPIRLKRFADHVRKHVVCKYNKYLTVNICYIAGTSTVFLRIRYAIFLQSFQGIIVCQIICQPYDEDVLCYGFDVPWQGEPPEALAQRFRATYDDEYQSEPKFEGEWSVICEDNVLYHDLTQVLHWICELSNQSVSVPTIVLQNFSQLLLERFADGGYSCQICRLCPSTSQTDCESIKAFIQMLTETDSEPAIILDDELCELLKGFCNTVQKYQKAEVVSSHAENDRLTVGITSFIRFVQLQYSVYSAIK